MADLRGMRKSILEMDESEVIPLHRSIRNNRLYIPPRKEPTRKKKSILTQMGSMTTTELDRLAEALGVDDE